MENKYTWLFAVLCKDLYSNIKYIDLSLSFWIHLHYLLVDWSFLLQKTKQKETTAKKNPLLVDTFLETSPLSSFILGNVSLIIRLKQFGSSKISNMKILYSLIKVINLQLLVYISYLAKSIIGSHAAFMLCVSQVFFTSELFVCFVLWFSFLV